MTAITFIPVSCSWLAKALEGEPRILLVDSRPSAQHGTKHVKTSENINFSNILLRRLMKGVVQLNSMISSKELEQRLSRRDSEKEKLVVYDACSRCDCVRTELVKHAEVIANTDHAKKSDSTVYFLDGGLDAFSKDYPHLCAAGKKAHSPLGISVSASLPIFSNLPTTTKRQFPKLQTPSEDSCSQFGPPVEILPHLVLGCAKDSSNLTQLRKRGVTAVLNVSHNCPNHFESVLEYKSIEVQDSYQADLLSKMDAAIDYINSVKAKNGCVFVHCHAGISRSATICIAYIMKTMQWDLSKAYEFVKERRPCISPNLHFMGQLLEFQKQLQESSESSAGAEEEMPDGNVEESTHDLSSNSAHSGLYYDVTLTSYDCPSLMEEDFDAPLAIQSASAPSSLNFDSDASKPICRVVTEPRRVTKPKTLPLFQKSKSHCPRSSMKDKKRESELIELKPHLCSVSLPNSPISQSKNHLPASLSPVSHSPTSRSPASRSPASRSPASQRTCHPLQFSPCGMAAALGSRSETSLNFYHTPLAESM